MSLILDGTNGETFPSWTTATRPASPATGQVGMNTTIGSLEAYNGTSWQQFTNGPAFSATLPSTQSITSTTWTKVQLSTETFDTASCFNNTGSTVGGIPAYAFLPNVAGYYQINGSVYGQATSTQNIQASIYKNGAQYSWAVSAPQGLANATPTMATVIYLNGSTDYVELYGFVNGTSPQINGNVATMFSGCLVRAA